MIGMEKEVSRLSGVESGCVQFAVNFAVPHERIMDIEVVKKIDPFWSLLTAHCCASHSMNTVVGKNMIDISLLSLSSRRMPL